MATAAVQNELTTCSICFENFRTPRILPCSHVFCQSCISSYIVSSCESKEAPVGFSCPLCREFVPSPTVLGEPEQWAEDLPVCKILNKMVNIGELNMCVPCQRENEKVKASEMCFTCEEPICETCAKFHKRILTTKNHHIVPLNEPGKALQFVTSLNINESCPHHSDKKIELHCIYHQQPCCSLCAGTEHGQCVGMETMQSAAEKIKKGKLVKVLRSKLNRFQQELLSSKKKQENNVTQIDCESDRIIDELQKLKKEIIDQLDELENKHINELSHITKKSKDILKKSIDSVSERIQFSGYCIQRLQNLGKTSDMSDVCFVKEYHRVRKSFEVLEWRTSNLKEHEMNLNSTILNKTHEITKMTCLTKISVEHLLKHIRFLYNPKFSLALVYEFKVVPHDDVYDGVIHSNGTITLPKYGNSKRGLQQYAMEADSYQQTMEYYSIHCFFGIVFNDNVYYATNRNENCVVVISKETFNCIRTIPINKNFIPYGICLWNEFFFVACQTAILKYNIDGRFIYEYPLDFNTLYVMVTSPGKIVYTNSKFNFVASMNQTGKQLWKYRNAKLRSPHGIDKDEEDNLYVGSTGMNSVHILSCDGSLIRIIEDVPKPVYIRVQTRSRTCCVCSNFRKIKVYKMILQ